MNLAITRLIENDSPRNLLVFVCLLICGTAFGAEKISDALFVVNKNDHCGYINSSGRLAIQMVFEDCRDFSEGLAPVQINKRWGFINQGGKLEIQPQFDECRWSFSEGLAAVRLGKNWGYIDPKGNFVIPPQFAYAQGFSEGRAVVLVGQKHGITDKTALLTDLFDDSGWSFSTGLLAVERDSQWGFVSLRGDVVIPLQFHRVKEFAEGSQRWEPTAFPMVWGWSSRTTSTVSLVLRGNSWSALSTTFVFHSELNWPRFHTVNGSRRGLISARQNRKEFGVTSTRTATKYGSPQE
jgi:WG containing repeat